MISFEEKILVSRDTCDFLVNYFDSSNCIKPGKKSQYSTIGEVGVVKASDIPNEVIQALSYFNIKTFPVLENVHSPHSFILHKYSVGDSFPPHRDDNISNYGSVDKKRALRYKTLVLQLSNEDSYTGGELIVNEIKVNSSQGNLVCFSSGLLHEVLPVTSGTRYSLALWLLKEDFNIKHSLL